MRSMADRGVWVMAAPGEDPGAIYDKVALADEAQALCQLDERDQQHLARPAARLRPLPTLLESAGHVRTTAGVGRRPAGARQGGSSHQPVVEALTAQAPQRAQQRQ